MLEYNYECEQAEGWLVLVWIESQGKDTTIAMADRSEEVTMRERVNLILGMFDEFYETYDIDENSPYFIPKEERVKGF